MCDRALWAFDVRATRSGPRELREIHRSDRRPAIALCFLGPGRGPQGDCLCEIKATDIDPSSDLVASAGVLLAIRRFDCDGTEDGDPKSRG